MSSDEDQGEPSGTGDSTACEPLACTTCRSRKLKCDRLKPACARCAKAGAECVYPESRRKPAFKRRNVKELEERLAQVEGFLKNAGRPSAEKYPAGGEPNASGKPQSGARFTGASADLDARGSFTSGPQEGQTAPGSFQPQQPQTSYSSSRSPEGAGNDPGGELLGLGRFESLPPFEMIEELHEIFFASKAKNFLPIVHQDRYLRSFYASLHMRPPMCLQYAIWTMAANGHEKYGIYHDVFYERTRRYLEADELKGYGEHFITVSHAQAWALTATDEARCLNFTRAAMSSARAVKLVEMMGLHRLDDMDEADNPISPTLTPPQDWTELEERRRVFWGVFCMDSHASISTGWPTLIDMSLVTTHLPASEDAFLSSREEKTSTIDSAFQGAQYSTFAGTVVTCHIFTKLLKHVHRPLPDDRPDDLEHGRFWKRHRELDNILSSTFMFLPERFRLPKYIRDQVAVNQNLNMHAAVICLHNAACDKVDKFKLPAQIKQISRARCLTAAYEIVNIMKLTSHVNTHHKSPLVALSMYCAASVFISQAKENRKEFDAESLEFLVSCMEAIGRQHVITRAYLNHLLLDIEHNGVESSLRMLPIQTPGACGYNIPLLARSSISFHTKPQPPLPGRLPLGKPQGTILRQPTNSPGDTWSPAGMKATATCGMIDTSSEDSVAPGSKRKRTSMGPNAGKSPPKDDLSMYINPPAWFRHENVSVDKSAPAQSSSSPDGVPSLSAKSNTWGGWQGAGGAVLSGPFRLPHRSNTPSVATSPSTSSGGPTVSTASTNITQASALRYSMMTSSEFLVEETVVPADLSRTMGTGGGGGNGLDDGQMMPDLNLFQGMDQWEDVADPELYAQMAAAVMRGSGSNSADGFDTQDSADAWTQLLSGAGDGSAGAAAWDPSNAAGQGGGNSG